jgi:thymidylate kinase
LRIARLVGNENKQRTQDDPSERAATKDLPAPSVVELVSQLSSALEAEGLRYCHWKSNEGLVDAPNGEIELDLLIGRGHSELFAEILSHLRFKQARTTRVRETPGVLDYYGMDEDSQRVVHVHAHYQLVMGDDTTRNIRLPIEEAYLDSAVPGSVFRVPSSEFEFVLFVIRMVLKHVTWDAILSCRGDLSKSERSELRYLESRVNGAKLKEILAQHLPFIDHGTFVRCTQALQPGCSTLLRIEAGRRLQESLVAHTRRPLALDTPLRLTRRGNWWVQRHFFGRYARKRLATGGALIAIVGGDGAGKSSAADELCEWLSRYFVVQRVHLGKPPWSLTTSAVKGTIVVGRRLGGFSSTKVRPYLLAEAAGGHPPSRTWLLWHALSARDRYRAYIRARRSASNGGLVVCDRYPLRQLHLMDGPASGWTPSWSDMDFLGQRLVDIENRYYKSIKDPDVLIVLNVDPNIAVQRKSDEDPEFVRARSTEVGSVSWDETQALVIDARRPKEEVLSEVKAAVWARL